MASKPTPSCTGGGGTKRSQHNQPCSPPPPRAEGSPHRSHLLIPTQLPPAREGLIHDIISHQEEGLELREVRWEGGGSSRGGGEGGDGPHCSPNPQPSAGRSPTRCTNPRPARTAGSQHPSAPAPTAPGTQPPPSAHGCISHRERCIAAPAKGGGGRGGGWRSYLLLPEHTSPGSQQSRYPPVPLVPVPTDPGTHLVPGHTSSGTH